MRSILTIILLFCVCSFTYSQELFKEKFQESAETTTVSWKDSANVFIDSFNSKKTIQSLQDLALFFKKNEVLQDTAFMNSAASIMQMIDSAMQVSSLTGFTFSRFDKDGTVTKLEAGASANCPELAKVTTVVLSRNAEGGFDVAFTDKKDNPVAGFELRDLNETFFYDRVSRSLYGLCDGTSPDKADTSKVNDLITNLKKKNLYQRMLEAGLEVNDEDVFAGKLTIRKEANVTLHFKKTGQTGRISDTASKSGSTVKLKTGQNPTLMIRSLIGSYSRFITVDSSLQARVDYGRGGFDPGSPADPEERVSKLTVYHIQIQFQDGFIENIKVRGKIPESNQLLKFENKYPIPFSTRRDFRKLYEIPLSETTIFERASKNNLGISYITLKLGDLLDFDQNLELDSKDYSPVNQVLDEEIKGEELVVNLKKERTSKILELRIFTDLKGIEDDNPNGLVQLELSKKLNFWNVRTKAFNNLFNLGLFNYFTPSFAMNKIENNRKRLPVQYIGSQEPDDSRPNNYVTTLQLLQYQAFRVGADISFMTLDIPGIKSILTLKTGFYFGRTLTVDTLREKVDSLTFNPIADNNIIESGVNSFQFIPEACFQIFPDKRYGVVLSYKANHYDLLSSQLRQVTDTIEYRNYVGKLDGDRSGIASYKASKWLGSAEIFAFYRPSATNQLFFRYRFNYDMSRVKTNFHQIQLGLTTYLTHTNKGKKTAAQNDNN